MKKAKKVKKGNQPLKITSADYIKAIKKADRETQLAEQAGFRSVTKVHKNKKTYDRKDNKRACTDTNE